AATHVDALRAAATSLPGGRLTLTSCLGPCSERDVVAVRHRDTGRPGRPLATTWLRRVDDAAVRALCEWVTAGAAGYVPAPLRRHRFEPADGDVADEDAISVSDRVR